jgi:hypothetical protein
LPGSRLGSIADSSGSPSYHRSKISGAVDRTGRTRPCHRKLIGFRRRCSWPCSAGHSDAFATSSPPTGADAANRSATTGAAASTCDLFATGRRSGDGPPSAGETRLSTMTYATYTRQTVVCRLY